MTGQATHGEILRSIEPSEAGRRTRAPSRTGDTFFRCHQAPARLCSLSTL